MKQFSMFATLAAASGGSAPSRPKMRFDTVSERLFAEICARHGYAVSKLPTREAVGIKTADFRVDTPAGSAIAEVEEICPNRSDVEAIEAIHRREIRAYGGTIGARARKAIRHGATQLKAHRDEGLPLVIVLFDNVCTEKGRAAYPMFYSGPEHIDAALFGDRIVYVPVVPEAPGRPDRSGGHRTFTLSEKRYVSAVAVIADEDTQALIVYHNPYADIPLDTSIWSDSKCCHMFKPSDVARSPWQWIKKKG